MGGERVFLLLIVICCCVSESVNTSYYDYDMSEPHSSHEIGQSEERFPSYESDSTASAEKSSEHQRIWSHRDDNSGSLSIDPDPYELEDYRQDDLDHMMKSYPDIESSQPDSDDEFSRLISMELRRHGEHTEHIDDTTEIIRLHHSDVGRHHQQNHEKEHDGNRGNVGQHNAHNNHDDHKNHNTHDPRDDQGNHNSHKDHVAHNAHDDHKDHDTHNDHNSHDKNDDHKDHETHEDHNAHDGDDDHKDHKTHKDHSNHYKNDDHKDHETYKDHHAHNGDDDHKDHETHKDHHAHNGDDDHKDHHAHNGDDDHKDHETHKDHHARNGYDDHEDHETHRDHNAHDKNDDHIDHETHKDHNAHDIHKEHNGHKKHKFHDSMRFAWEERFCLEAFHEEEEPFMINDGSFHPRYEEVLGVGVYRLHARARSWAEARRVCEREGAQLAVPNSREEALALADIHNRCPHLLPTHFNDYQYLGVHDNYNEGGWETVVGHSLNDTGYVNWAFNQPDNAHHIGENCLTMNRNTFFNDVPCWTELPFICEHP